MAESPLLNELTALEQRLHDPAVRCNSAEMDRLLADEFREFGKSGRVHDKAAIVRALADEALEASGSRIEASEFVLVRVSPEAVLLTYRSASAGRIALRSSLWIYRDGRWQMLFHQGTLSEGPERDLPG